MRHSTVGAALLVSICAIGTSAGAHIALDQPPPRDTAMKTPPCGGTNPRSATPAAFAPGQKVTVKWHETVVHPGFFRVAFSTDGKTFPTDPTDPPAPVAPPVLAIVPKVSGITAYSADITLPDTPCETCTIQVIQYMEQHAPPPYYYQCADIAIRQGAGGMSSGGRGGAANASGGNTASGGTGGASGGTAGASGGTASASGGTASASGGTAGGASAGGGASGTTNLAGTTGASGSADAGSASGHDGDSGCALAPQPRRRASWLLWFAALWAGRAVRRRMSALRNAHGSSK